ncbi:MAG TPA: response regulator, partial [Polyangiaceae bacterium]|nr:response regulator [Polyangiaceae bacterium]
EAGKMDVRAETISTARLVEDLLTTFTPVAQDKQLALSARVDPAVPQHIFSDATRLAQIIKNLLSNALKFTEHGGVTLSVEARSLDRIVFAVTDTGIGIPDDQQQTIFEAFHQADGTVNRKYGGTGLGLSISRDLARLLGGELSVESSAGRGSTFTLILPARYEGPVAAPASASLGPPLKGAVPLQDAVPLQGDVVHDSLNDRERANHGSRLILIIEDDVAFAQIIQDLAHEFDFQTVAAQTGAEGLAMAERFRPSAILLDVGLPDRSGLSVLDSLKHNPVTRHIPVHVISVADHTQTALEMGAAGYGLKPIQREQLLLAFKRLESKFTQALRRILVVEDDEDHLSSTCRLLAADNVETIPATTAAQALELLSASTFDCMVMDLSLPDRNGFELLEEMSRKEQYSVPPVIVYTGRSLSREEEQRLRKFSSSIIIKGARSPERLLDEVTLFLHQVEAELPPDRQRMLRNARHREAVFEERRVLVVEDDVRNIFAITSVLEPKGAKIEIARNGREALE